MYEHLRNTFLTELSAKFSVADINYIGTLLDKVCADYTISEKETALAVLEDNIPYLVKLYLTTKTFEGRSNDTIDNYFGILRIFFETVRKSPKDVQTNDIRMFLAQYQMHNKVSNRTLDKYRQVLGGFFAWCTDEEYITKNPCKNIYKIKYETKQRHALTRKQFEKLRRNCKTKRDLAIIDVLYSTGCRASELINMKFSDIDMNTESIHIIGKGSKHNIVYLNSVAQLSLEDYINNERKGDSDYIFVSMRKPYDKLSRRSIEVALNKIGNSINIHAYPHLVRHTMATNAYKNGMDLYKIQKLLGHSSVTTTQIYAEMAQEDVALAHKQFVV